MRNSDLPAGLAAIAALAATVFLGHLPFWLGLIAAILVYAGLALLFRRAPDTTAPARPPIVEQIAALEATGARIALPDTRRHVAEITSQARAIAAYFAEHPASTAQWEGYLREALDTALAGARQFAELAPHLSGPTDPTAAKFAEFLQTLSDTLRGVYSQLLATDTADFAASMDAYKNTLQEINQIYLGGGTIK